MYPLGVRLLENHATDDKSPKPPSPKKPGTKLFSPDLEEGSTDTTDNEVVITVRVRIADKNPRCEELIPSENAGIHQDELFSSHLIRLLKMANCQKKIHSNHH